MKVQICNGIFCKLKGAKYIEIRLNSDAKKMQVPEDELEITTCPCQGQCSNAVNMWFDDKFVMKMNPATASQQLKSHFKI